MNIEASATEAVRGVEHWTRKGDVPLFLYERILPSREAAFAAPDAPLLLLVRWSIPSVFFGQPEPVYRG